jgi:precorrin-4/cobalt-precorrin-4 C11-methyltransferase
LISFVGAGPGAPDLITLRGADRLSRADVVVWASSLVPEAVLGHCQPTVTVHDSAIMTLEDVLAVFEEHPEPARIVRLHSGDPTLYGAIGEQLDWCFTHARSWEIVPGVSSLAAAAARAGRELTQPGVSQSVVLTRLAGRTHQSMPHGEGPSSEGVAAFAAHGATMAVFLSGARPEELQDELLAPGSGYRPDTPAVVVIKATWPEEQVVETTVGRLAAELRGCGTTLTVLVLVGETLRNRPVAQRSHLYEPSFTTTYRLRSKAGSTEGRPSRGRR